MSDVKRYNGHYVTEFSAVCSAPVYVSADDYDRLREALERVYHYWMERYGLDFGKADETLMLEITRVQDALAGAASQPDAPGPVRKHDFERKSSTHYPCKHCGQDMLGPYTPWCPTDQTTAGLEKP